MWEMRNALQEKPGEYNITSEEKEKRNGRREITQCVEGLKRDRTMRNVKAIPCKEVKKMAS